MTSKEMIVNNTAVTATGIAAMLTLLIQEATTLDKEQKDGLMELASELGDLVQEVDE